MTRTQKTQILDRLEEMYPDAKAELVFSNPYEMLVATMLSAQCTDKQQTPWRALKWKSFFRL